jgi:serine protease Do
LSKYIRASNPTSPTADPKCSFSSRSLITLTCLAFLLQASLLFAGKEDRIPDVVETASKAIVNIRTEELSRDKDETQRPNVIRKFLEGTEEEEEFVENFGSGVVLDPTGIIVTNEHLISKAINIRVKFLNGKEYEAYVLGSDPEFDIALLKVAEKVDQLPYMKITEPKSVRVGERVIVIGNPFGLQSSVTIGVVSFLGRNLKSDNKVYANLIQTDAAINPGNSGGALLDIEGNPLGIVTAIYGEGKGIGFAIPIEDVMNMLSEFLRKGAKRPIFGLFIEKRRDEGPYYLYVSGVLTGSPAEAQGIKVGDKITELNKKRIKEGTKIQSILRNVDPSQALQARILRGTKASTVIVGMREVVDYLPNPIDKDLLGFQIADIKGYPKLKFKLREKDGVVVTKVAKGGIAEKSGLLAGDVIVRINNEAVTKKADFNSYTIEGLQRNYILFQVKRYDEIFFLPVKLDSLL